MQGKTVSYSQQPNEDYHTSTLSQKAVVQGKIPPSFLPSLPPPLPDPNSFFYSIPNTSQIPTTTTSASNGGIIETNPLPESEQKTTVHNKHVRIRRYGTMDKQRLYCPRRSNIPASALRSGRGGWGDAWVMWNGMSHWMKSSCAALSVVVVRSVWGRAMHTRWVTGFSW